MKKLVLTLVILIVLSASANAQIINDFSGNWFGKFPYSSMELRMALIITKDSGSLKSTLISMDQGNTKIEASQTDFVNDSLKIIFKKYKIAYYAKINAAGDTLSGIWKQGGDTPLKFVKVDSIPVPKRPQDPKPPYSYISEDVTFKNLKEGITLAGTITYPKTGGPFPAVILVSGSGQQNRDEEILGHKPFAVIADYLSSNGIAVLRYDDRGVGKSEGNPTLSTSLDFSYDAEAAFEFLRKYKNIDSNKVGIAGHSEGGMIAPMVAARNNKVGFVIMLAGPGISGKEILLAQNNLISKAMGIPADSIIFSEELNNGIYDIVLKTKDNKKAASKIKDLMNKKSVGMSETQKKAAGFDPISIAQTSYTLTIPWMRYFLAYQPASVLKKVKCPILALNGEKDLQVPMKEDLEAIKKITEKAGNKNVTIVELPGLNHLFQECSTGNPAEYAEIEMTFSPDVLKLMTKWINGISK